MAYQVIGDSAPTITTERLILRQPREADFDAFALMWTDPIVTRYFDGVARPRGDSWRSFMSMFGHWHLFGYGYFVVLERASGGFCGTIGFSRYERELGADFDEAPESGWSFASSFHGRGLASEALRAMLAWGEVANGFSRTVCLISPNNAPSIRVAEKCGYRRVRETIYSEKPALICERRP